MDKRFQKMVLTCALIVYALVMIVGAIIPNPEDVPLFAGNTKYFHLIGFIILSLMVFRTLQLYKVRRKNTLSIVLLVFFIVLTEVLQLFVSTRHFSLYDMLIDMIGCAVGWGLYKLIYNK
jgi:VanZ family protein